MIAPEFKNGRFDMCVIADVSTIIGTVRGEFQVCDTSADALAERFMKYWHLNHL